MKSWFFFFFFSPLHSDGDLASVRVQGVEPALHEQSPLQAEGGDQEVEAHAAKTVALQEGHEESKPNEDHDMDVLETCRVRERERERERDYYIGTV